MQTPSSTPRESRQQPYYILQNNENEEHYIAHTEIKNMKSEDHNEASAIKSNNYNNKFAESLH